MDVPYAKMALPQVPVFQLRIIFVIKSLGAGGRTLYEAALCFFYPLVNLDLLLLFYTSSVKLCLQYFVSLFTNLAWTPATVKEENLHVFRDEAGNLRTLLTIARALA